MNNNIFEKVIPSNIVEINVEEDERLVLSLSKIFEDNNAEINHYSFNELISGKWFSFMTNDCVSFCCHERYADDILRLETQINTTRVISTKSEYNQMLKLKKELESASELINNSLNKIYEGPCYSAKCSFVKQDVEVESKEFGDKQADDMLSKLEYMVTGDQEEKFSIFDVRERLVEVFCMEGVTDDIVGIVIIPKEEDNNPLDELFERISNQGSIKVI